MNSVQVPSHPLRVPIDPRIRQRRMEVRRDEGRRRLRLLLGVVALAFFSTVAWLSTRSPLLDVDAVEVEGSTRTPAQLVRQAAGLDRGTAMVDVDEGAVAERVESLPWVAEAQVERRWPGTVSIAVTERSALVATLDQGGTWSLLDGSGRVLGTVDGRPTDLVAVEGLSPLPGAGGTAADAAPALTVSAALSPALRARVDAVVVVESGGVDLRLKGSGVVRLGDLEKLGQKLRAAESVLASVDLRGLATLDVSLPASPVLTRQ